MIMLTQAHDESTDVLELAGDHNVHSLDLDILTFRMPIVRHAESLTVSAGHRVSNLGSRMTSN